MENIISANNISISYHGKNILQDVSLNLGSKEIVTIIGPNGSGKTTLLKVILGTISGFEGEVSIKKGLKIGYMPQKFAINKIMPLTVRRFLRLGPDGGALRKISKVEKISKKLDIKHLMKQQIHNISGGELQRVILTRALLLEPDCLILDEPTSALDVQGIAEFYKLIEEIKEDYGCSVLMVSHDLHLVMSSTDRVVCMNHHICCEGRPEDISKDKEYLNLYGKGSIAIYEHKHDHTH